MSLVSETLLVVMDVINCRVWLKAELFIEDCMFEEGSTDEPTEEGERRG